MSAQLHFLQPAHAPGLHNLSVDELVRLADAEPNPSPLLRALAEALADACDGQAALEDAYSEWSNKEAEWDAEHAALEAKIDDLQEEADALRYSLRAIIDYAERDVGELADLANDDDDAADAEAAGEEVEEARRVLAQYPSAAEKAATERARAAAEFAAIEEAEKLAPGFALLRDKSVILEYMKPRGRKWHVAGHTFKATPQWVGEALTRVPEGAVARCVAG